MSSPFIRVLLLVSSLVIIVVVHPSEAGVTTAKQNSYASVTTAKQNSYDASNERDIQLLKDTLEKLEDLYTYIGKIIATLTGSLNADGKSEYQKSAADKEVEEQLDSLATLHKVFDKVMDKVRARVLALMEYIMSGGSLSPGNEANRVRRFVQSLHDNLQFDM